METFTIYRKADGAIEGVYSGPKDTIQLQLKDNQYGHRGNYPDNEWYFDLKDQVMREQPEIPAKLNKTTLKADGTDSIVITGLPTNDLNKNPIETEVRVNGTVYQVSGGELELTVDAPGEYRITCRATNHKPLETKVEAHDDDEG